MNNTMSKDTLHPTVIHSRRDLYQRLTAAGWLPTLSINTIASPYLYEGDNRFDSRYYTSEVVAAKSMVIGSGLPVYHLSEPIITNKLFVLDRFRRTYATDQNAGWSYLSASDVLAFRPQSNRYLAKNHAPPNAEQHFVQPDWLLMTCSGTVGRLVLSSDRLTKFFLTHDLIRIVPSVDIKVGYLYAYLSSSIGQTLITRDQYGSAIKHLEPHHIAGVPVPMVPTNMQESLHNDIMRAYALRDEANTLLDEADELLHQELGIPRFQESMVPYLPAPSIPSPSPPGMPALSAFTVSSKDLADRFDASYHVPVTRTAILQLQQGKYPVLPLGNVVQRVFIPPRFKRIYVTEGYGVPFLRPSHLPQYKPMDLQYIAESTDVLDLLRLNHGEVMIVTDGTVGTVSLVSSFTDGWAGSNNIGRISFGESETDRYRNGFLAAFLMTPYGHYQVAQVIYGSVIDHIEEKHIKSVIVPDVPMDIHIRIGEKVVAAFEKKDEAIVVEKDAIRRLEQYLENISSSP